MTDILSPPTQVPTSELFEVVNPPDLFEEAVQKRVDDELRNYRSFAAREQALFEMRVLPNDQLHREVEAKLAWLLGTPSIFDNPEVTIETRHGIELNDFTRFLDSPKGPLAVDRVYTTAHQPPAWFIKACEQKPSPQPTTDGHCPDVGAWLLALFED